MEHPVLDFVRTNGGLRIILTSLLLFSAYAIARYHRSPWRKVPRGPRGYPLIGNALELGGSKLWLKLTKWRDAYGDLVYLNAAGKPVIIINSVKAAVDLLDRRAANTSNRPKNIVASDLLTGGMFMTLQNLTDEWRRMRKASHEHLSKSNATAYHASQVTESVLLALGVLAEPKEWEAQYRRASASFTMNLMYGTAEDPTQSKTTGAVEVSMEGVGMQNAKDKRIEQINDFVARLTSALLPGAFIVEFFPWMRHFPSWMAKWKRDAEDSFRNDSAMFEGLMEGVQKRLARGEEPTSVMGKISRDSSRYDLSLRENAWLAAGMYSAGAETTAGVMTWWTLAMLLYPDVQARAQAELDSVVGRERVPTFKDYDNLPYLRAMVKEALRWHTVDPLGMPHRAAKEDWYEGYYIPAGSLIIANVWLLNQDINTWGEDALEFRPERYLRNGAKTDKSLSGSGREESDFTYGFGRRVCVGRHVANNSLFIEMAMILWAMKLERPVDEKGAPVPIDVDGCIEAGVVVHPIPFKIKATPRFPEAVTVLEHEKEASKL